MRRRFAGPVVFARPAGVAATLLALAPLLLRTQPTDSTVVQAALARRAFQDAAAATTLRHALPHLVRAARAWPTQSSYWVSMARVGARLSDTAAVQEALSALAPMGVGTSLLSDTALDRMAQLPALRRLRETMSRTSGPVVGSRVVRMIADSTVFAEGIDADPKTGALYVASIRQRSILEVAADGRIRDLDVSRAPRVGAIFGVRVAADGRHLYATTAGVPMMRGYARSDSTLAAVLRVRIADGAVVQRWDVPVDGAPHLLGDLAIGEDGTVYATDSRTPGIYILRPGADTFNRISDPIFRSLQGLASIPGRRQLVVADYSHGLLRVDLASRAVVRIADAPGSTMLGIDGIVWHDGAVIAVQNGVQSPRVLRIVLNADGSRVERFSVIDRQPEVADEPTIGTVWRDGFVYVANSQWNAYDDAGQRRPGTSLRGTTLLCVPLRSDDAKPTAGCVR